MLSTEITRIQVANGKARSVMTSQGQEFTADQFLFDGDAQLSLDLIGAEHFPKAFQKKLQYEYGTSVLSVYLGLKEFDLWRHDSFKSTFGCQNMLFSPNIVEKVIGSPLTNEFYVRAPRGNCYSTPLDPKHVNLRRLNYKSPFPNLYYVGASSCLPGFATIIHFACMLHEKLMGDRI